MAALKEVPLSTMVFISLMASAKRLFSVCSASISRAAPRVMPASSIVANCLKKTALSLSLIVEKACSLSLRVFVARSFVSSISMG